MSITKYPTAHPVYGFPTYANIADFHPYGGTSEKLLDAVSTDTTSASSTPEARGVKISLVFSDAATSCDLELYQVGSPDVLVYTWEGLSYAQPEAFAGPSEQVDMQGSKFKVKAIKCCPTARVARSA